MKTKLTFYLICSSFLCVHAASQERVSDAGISLFTGTINYQGDLKPNSFTFQHSNPSFSIVLHKPLNRWLTWQTGFSRGKIEGADRYNRDYLKLRNLSFYTNITELYSGFAFNVLDISTKRFTPYIYGGVGVFHFNPWTYDQAGNKVRLQPLSTEGQGLPGYPGQKKYKLTQPELVFGGGIKFALNDCVALGIELSQRKTFTDYLDDVSTHYIDQDKLLAAKGPKAVELAYRGNQLPGGAAYPPDGEQRGTASEMDWYYFFGLTIEIKFDCIKNLFSGITDHNLTSYHQKCPRF